MLRGRVKSVLCMIAAVILMVTAAFYGVRIYRYYAELNAQTDVFAQLADTVQVTEAVSGTETLDEDDGILANYRRLAAQNADLVGWISIDGTSINYPVMQSVDDPNYYLTHNFEKAYSTLGTPYVQENCDVDKSDNLIIYGHHIRGGRMFAALDQYMEESFCKEHSVIRFDTLRERSEYEVLAVFKTALYSDDVFPYYDFVDAQDEAAFDSYVAGCRELSLYDTGVTASYGDRLITLSTCEYSAENGRLVVVARKIK